MAADALPDLLKERRDRRPLWRRALYFVLAIALFVLGIAGWLIPVVTGIPFHLAALVFLALASDRAVVGINWLERRLPESWRRGLRRGISKVPSKKLQEAINAPPSAGVGGSGPTGAA